jgi:hypothetical protein
MTGCSGPQRQHTPMKVTRSQPVEALQQKMRLIHNSWTWAPKGERDSGATGPTTHTSHKCATGVGVCDMTTKAKVLLKAVRRLDELQDQIQ